jgi:WD40 repeat protein
MRASFGGGFPPTVLGVRGVAFAPDGKLLASHSGDDTICLWELRTGKRQGTLKGHTSTVNAIAWRKGDRLLASAGQEGTIWFWDADSGKGRFVIAQPEGFWSVAFAPDGKTLATGDSEGVIKLWDVATLLRQKAKKKSRGHQ